MAAADPGEYALGEELKGGLRGLVGGMLRFVVDLVGEGIRALIVLDLERNCEGD